MCTPTQMSYAVVNRYGVSDYSPVNIECLGMFIPMHMHLCNISNQFPCIHNIVVHIEALHFVKDYIPPMLLQFITVFIF